MVDSCRECDSCKHDLEQYCSSGLTGTYNGHDKHLGGHTFGGYSEKVVVDEHFVLKVPSNLDLAGYVIGGIAETQELLDFCGEHNIVSEIEIIKMQDINEAYERMLKSDVRYRFVIDMASL